MQKRNRGFGKFLFSVFIIAIIGWILFSPQTSPWFQHNISWILTIFAIALIVISALRYIFNKRQGSLGKTVCLLLIAVSFVYLAWIYLVPLLISILNWFKQNSTILIALLVSIAVLIVIAWRFRRKWIVIDTTPSSIMPSEKAGYIYMSSSPALKEDIFKVGMTRRKPEDRMEELGQGTGVPARFLILHSWTVSDCVKAESLIHEALKQYRLNPNREFFQASSEKIYGIADQIVRDINDTN